MSLLRRIAKEQDAMVKCIKGTIALHDYICITADAWTGFKNRKTFLGVTGHVIDGDLQRKSFPLACRLFPGSHSYDRIAKLLFKIFKSFQRV